MILKRFFYPAIVLLVLSIIACNSGSTKKAHGEYKRNFTNDEIESAIAELLGKMSIEEKIGQLNQRGGSSRSPDELDEDLMEEVRRGAVGSFLNITNKKFRTELQRIAVEESPHGIPLMFGRDVIHGFKTIFPIPLAQAASWNSNLVEEGARIAAYEATSYGINWTFAPMMDIARDARWGRIAESFGEDPYLSSVMAVAMVEGFQGDFGERNIAACAKHFAAYGAAEGGRDYNTAQVPEYLLREIYLPPFKAASDAGAATFMSAFNDINGIPASGNKLLLNDILRNEWGFDGFVVSDWHSVIEMIPHGYAADNKDAALKGLTAGVDMEMMSTSYADHVKELIDEGKITLELLDERVTAILRVKFRLGLFDNPGFDATEEGILLTEEHREAARKAAVESMVLLENKNNVLPLDKSAKIALIGPLAHAPHEQLGTWIFDGEARHSETPFYTLQNLLGSKLKFEPGLEYSRSKNDSKFNEALNIARQSDIILFVGGEEAIISGEAHSRANIRLPGKQEELIKKLKSTGKPIVLVVLAGRPITFENIIDDVDAILFGWHPGTMTGPALTDLLYGVVSPSGRLPVSWPKEVGQIPIYYNHYNTGRPASNETFIHIDSIPVGAWQSSLGNTSHYLDLGFKPQYPFGYGLTYSEVKYSNLRLNSESMDANGSLEISAIITNKGNVTIKEVVQLYVRDLVAERIRPVRELKDFKKITLAPGESKEVNFTISANQLSYWNLNMEEVVEPGEFHVWIAPNANEGLQASFFIGE